MANDYLAYINRYPDLKAAYGQDADEVNGIMKHMANAKVETPLFLDQTKQVILTLIVLTSF